VGLRLLGVGLNRQPVSFLSSAVEPWLIGSVTLMFASGIPLFMSESIKCYWSLPFWVKMTCLFLVLLLTFTFRRYVTRTNLPDKRPLLAASRPSYRYACGSAWPWGAAGSGFLEQGRTGDERKRPFVRFRNGRHAGRVDRRQAGLVVLLLRFQHHRTADRRHQLILGGERNALGAIASKADGPGGSEIDNENHTWWEVAAVDQRVVRL
jgi:hypothetical protein